MKTVMMQKIVSNSTFFKLIGAVTIITCAHFLLKTGYHILYYHETQGLEPLTFGYPKPFFEVVIEFAFWFMLLIGGIGISTNKQQGLLLGQFSSATASIPALIYLITSAGKVSTYSRSIMINSSEREMTNLEKWNYMYVDLSLSIILVIIIIGAFTLLQKRKNYLREVQRSVIMN